MNRKSFSILFITVILSLALISCGKQQETQHSHAREKKQETGKIAETNKEDKIRSEIRAYLQNNNLNGVVTVVKENQPIFDEGVGYADLQKKIQNQPDTTFPIGSITKIFVSTCVMMLQEQGKLNIQDPISKYIPDFPNGQNIKLYHFLTHTSGIHRPRWQKGDTTPLKLVQEIERQPAQFQPGMKWDYLDANYMILGYVVEKVTGMNLHDYIRTTILDKVPLKETGFITPDHPVPYTSTGYLQNDGKIEPTKYLNIYPLFACGDIYTSASDLSKFDEALMDGRLISMASIQQILTPSQRSSYGLGLYNKEGKIFSVGVLGGWFSMHAYYPDKTSIVVLLNSRSKKTNIEQLTQDIRQIQTVNGL